MGLFFFFDDNRSNLALFFLVSTFVLYLGPGWFMPSLKADRIAPGVNAPAGKLVGVKMLSRDGRDLFAYKGIPFAKPPVGNLRFRRPEPLDKPWKGVFDASTSGSACKQPFIFYPYLLGDEDCLKLNVYVPGDAEKNKLLPVMVWIHGGGFTMGDGSDKLAGPQYLLDRDVLLVTLQYRLGPWGSLNLGSELVSGNQAMWDQRLGLQWVQKNIAAFGGDPKRVTLFGESAGSTSVMSHLLSNPESKAKGKKDEKLFHAAIAMSGVPQGALLGIDKKRSMVEFHKEFSASMGCPIKDKKDIAEVLECLQAKSMEDIAKGIFMFDECSFYDGLMASPSPWKPVLDSDSTSDSFFADKPDKLAEECKLSDVPLMIGFTRDEGLLGTAFLLAKPDKQKLLRDEWDSCMLTNLLGTLKSDQTEEDVKLLRKLEAFYFKGKDRKDVTLENSFQNLTNMFTDYKYSYGVDLVVRACIEKTSHPTFYYHFDHVGSYSNSDIFSRKLPSLILLMLGKMVGYHTTSKLGVSHSDDLLYIFGSSMPFKMLSDPADEVMSRQMVDMWVNFATFHHPTPKDKEGQFVGNSLKGKLNKSWEPSKIAKGNPTYAVLRDAGIHFDEETDVDVRLEFIRSLNKGH